MRLEDYDYYWDDQYEEPEGEYEPPPLDGPLKWRVIELVYWPVIAVFLFWLLLEAARHPALAHFLTAWP